MHSVMSVELDSSAPFFGQSLVSRRFGRITIIEYGGCPISRVVNTHRSNRPSNGSSFYWHGICECGTPTLTLGKHLLSGRTQSCGCLSKELTSVRNRTHGLAKHPLYRKWVDMHTRCSNPKSQSYKYYGGRGITVCERWKSFEDFYHDMIPTWKRGLTLERKEANGNYTPENCIWATHIEQCNNRRRNRKITFNGQTLTAIQWERKIGKPWYTIVRRLNSGWSVEDALTKTDRKLRRRVKK